MHYGTDRGRRAHYCFDLDVRAVPHRTWITPGSIAAILGEDLHYGSHLGRRTRTDAAAVLDSFRPLPRTWLTWQSWPPVATIGSRPCKQVQIRERAQCNHASVAITCYSLRRSGPFDLREIPALTWGGYRLKHLCLRKQSNHQVRQVFVATITDLGNLWPAQASPTKAAAGVEEARYFPEPAGHRKQGWIAAPWVIPADRHRSVPRNQRGSSVRSASASRGQTNTYVQ